MEWSFLHDMLISLNFLPHFIKIIMVCINLTHYFIMLNSGPSYTINPRRGLRQSDPISPLLFVIGVEYFSRILMVIGLNKQFKFYPKCWNMQPNHLSFANDLMLFCWGDLNSAQLLCHGLSTLTASTELCANHSKPSIYLVAYPMDLKFLIA